MKSYIAIAIAVVVGLGAIIGGCVTWAKLEKIHPAAAQNVLRTASLLRDEAQVLDALVDAEVDSSDGSPRGTVALVRLTVSPMSASSFSISAF